MPELGARGYPFILALRGDVSVPVVKKTVNEIIDAIKMQAIFEPALYKYDDDVGFIYIQPIYESFIAFDAWPKHSGGYLTVFSCKHYDAFDVMAVITRNGFKVTGVQGSPMKL